MANRIYFTSLMCAGQILICVALLGLPFGAQAQSHVPQVNVDRIRDFVRLNLQWPYKVKFSANAQGTKLTLRFDKTAKPDTRGILEQMHPYITKVDKTKDGKTLILTMNKPYRVRTFISGNSTGVDLLKVDATPAPREMAAKDKPPGSIKKKPVEPVKPTIEPPKAKKIKVPEPPAQNKIPAPTVPAQTEVRQESPAPVTPSQESPSSEKISLPSLETTQASAIPPSSPSPTSALTTALSPAQTDMGQYATQLVFPLKEQIAAAVFTRGNFLWIIFNKPGTVDISALSFSPPLVNAEQIPHERYTILRIATQGEAYPVARQATPGFDWVVGISDKLRRPQERIPTTIRDSTVLAESPTLADPITVTDPTLGDRLIIIPSFTPGQGIFPARDFVEFSFLPSPQGIVVQQKADGIRADRLPEGIKIFKDSGLIVSPDLPPVEMSAPQPSDTFFPYDQWRVETPKEFLQRRQQYLTQSQDANPDIANEARMKLAQLLLSEGRANETLGVLSEIETHDPEFFYMHKLSALRGGANFLLFRLIDAQTNFSAEELAGKEETDLWKTAIGEMLGTSSTSFDYLKHEKAYISQYPPTLRHRLAVIASDLAIGRGEYNTALNIFDTINKDKNLDEVRKYMDFMRATISSRTGQEPAAIELWQRLAEDTSDRFIRARAEYALVTFLMDEGRITQDEAIARLDKLRIVWRGDSLEISLLDLLGRLYLEKGQHLNALRALREIVTNFPNTQEAQQAAQKMAETFVELFNHGKADGMTPLQALTLYYEFRELTPAGKQGDQMIQNLADRLTQVDLLDRAAALLNHQIRFRLEREERSRVGARLALIYLLNRQPLQALETLQLTGYGANPGDLQHTRSLLTARALSDLGQYDKALRLIDADESEEAQMLKVNIYWESKNWPQVIKAVEQRLGNRPDITAPLTLEESEYLLKLALAYSFTQDQVQLQYLKDYFTPLMQDSPHRDTFLFITGINNPVDHRNFDQVSRDVARIKTFIGNMESKVKKDGLSAAVN